MINLLRHLSGVFNGMAIRTENLCYGKMGEKAFMQKYDIKGDLLAQNSEFKNLHKGKRCFIVGNGPSLNQQDLSLLADEQVFTVNFIFKSEQFAKMKTNYHLFMDESCFDESVTPIEYFNELNTQDNSPFVFFPANVSENFVKKNQLDKLYACRYLFDFIPFNVKKPIENDITKGISGFYTVVQTAILVAVYMGFSEIYLLGCDCTGIIANINACLDLEIDDLYAYNITKEDKKMFKDTSKTDDTNRMQNIFEGWVNMFEGYKRLYEFCNSKNVKLFNATNAGVLESIPRVNYEKIINEK